MDKVLLGRTGLSVSVAGLGCGGHSRLGMAYGHDETQAAEIVSAALDLGINFIDTARAYGTESAVGRAIRGRRSELVLSTKCQVGRGEEMISGPELVSSVELSLQRLGTDYIDVFNLHGVRPSEYNHSAEELVPVLQKLRAEGKIRFLGITEMFGADTNHDMFQKALIDDYFDVVMVGFNLLNPSARNRVFPHTIQHNVATQIMFAVRRALSQPEAVGALIAELVDSGEVDAGVLDPADPLGFITAYEGVDSVVDAAYRFCRHEPGATVVLTGTGNVAHLQQNVQSILAPPLPPALQAQLASIFGRVTSVSGN
ncbi:MAG: aldo/keto reductase [Pseudomonadales bacterium]|nr:aldo/keto reductase [Pseudomonadales bacterium]